MNLETRKALILRILISVAFAVAAGLVSSFFFITNKAHPVISSTEQRPQRAFEVIDSGGRLLKSEDLKGQWLLVFFGELHAMDFCSNAFYPITSALALQDQPFQIVLPVFVSLNPERDTPDALAKYSRSLFFRFLLTQAPTDRLSDMPDSFSRLTVTNGMDTEILAPTEAIHLLDTSGREAATIPCTASGVDVHSLVAAAIKSDLARAQLPKI